MYSCHNNGGERGGLADIFGKNNGYLVSKEELLNHVWCERNVHEHTVLVTLSGVRKIDCRCIVAIAKLGCVFYPHRAGLEKEWFNDAGKNSTLWFY